MLLRARWSRIHSSSTIFSPSLLFQLKASWVYITSWWSNPWHYAGGVLLQACGPWYSHRSAYTVHQSFQQHSETELRHFTHTPQIDWPTTEHLRHLIDWRTTEHLRHLIDSTQAPVVLSIRVVSSVISSVVTNVVSSVISSVVSSIVSNVMTWSLKLYRLYY